MRLRLRNGKFSGSASSFNTSLYCLGAEHERVGVNTHHKAHISPRSASVAAVDVHCTQPCLSVRDILLSNVASIKAYLVLALSLRGLVGRWVKLVDA